MASEQYGSDQYLKSQSKTAVPTKRKRESSQQMQAPTANMSDHSDTSYLNSHQDHGLDHSQFDLSELQHNNENALHQNGSSHGADPSDTAAAALSHYSMSMQQSGEQQFLNTVGSGDGDHQMSQFGLNSHGDSQGMNSEFTIDPDDPSGQADGSPTAAHGKKPAVGTVEWHKVRKDNHKEVERRRRETINEGINELQKIVPNCEKNKGGILARAVQYITQLKENEQGNIEKWTLEKLLTEQAISELSSRCESLQQEVHRARAEVDSWKRVAREAGADMEAARAAVTQDAIHAPHTNSGSGSSVNTAAAAGATADIEGLHEHAANSGEADDSTEKSS